MVLEFAAFLSMAAKCAPGIEARDLASHGLVESHYETLAIGDNTTKQPVPTPPSTAAAIATANELLGAGHNLDIGLMQINANNFDWLGLTLETAFDGCQSIRAARDHLQAASRYNSGSDSRGLTNGYVSKIMKARYGTPPQAAVPVRSQPASPVKTSWPAGPDPLPETVRVFPPPGEDPRK